jgi:hypothetical protein
MLAVGRNQRSHELDQFGRKEWVEREVVDRDRFAVVDLDLLEFRLLEFVDEVTLRQGTRHSAGPRGRVQEDLGRELLVADGEVGERELASGA